jgi:hypothetical protein
MSGLATSASSEALHSSKGSLNSVDDRESKRVRWQLAAVTRCSFDGTVAYLDVKSDNIFQHAHLSRIPFSLPVQPQTRLGCRLVLIPLPFLHRDIVVQDVNSPRPARKDPCDIDRTLRDIVGCRVQPLSAPVNIPKKTARMAYSNLAGPRWQCSCYSDDHTSSLSCLCGTTSLHPARRYRICPTRN